MCSKVDELPAARTTGPPAVPVVEPALTVIRPAHGWQWIDVAELWRFHELIFFLAWRDVKVRYKQTFLGAAWAILQPALMTVVFTIGFGSVMHIEPPKGYEGQYPLFVFAGLLPWSFFATAVANAGNSVVGSERLISKVYFPRLAVPFASVGAALVDLVVASGMLAVLMMWYGRGPVWGWQLLLAPVFVGLMTLLALGVGTFLAALNVSYRDFKYVIPFMVQVWMYATATIYTQPSPASLNSWVHVVLAANPMTALVGGFRAAVLGGEIDWLQVGIAAAVGVVAFVGGCLYFRRVEDTFADLI
ncbi:MAG TPA: phosphate ABC transporter permease [Planctomycetales bacterium]|jgi:lipopolysaccharide transport system permease protein|nr:phosphate ABC transporter permease [Planctomycetales bacterium]